MISATAKSSSRQRRRAPLSPREQMVLDVALIFGGFQQRFARAELLAFLHAGGEKDYSETELTRIMDRLVAVGEFRRVGRITYARSAAAAPSSSVPLEHPLWPEEAPPPEERLQ